MASDEDGHDDCDDEKMNRRYDAGGWESANETGDDDGGPCGKTYCIQLVG